MIEYTEDTPHYMLFHCVVIGIRQVNNQHAAILLRPPALPFEDIHGTIEKIGTIELFISREAASTFLPLGGKYTLSLTKE